MPDPASLSPERLALLERARKLGQLRRCSPALRSDARKTLHVGAETYAYLRSADDRVALVMLSRADEAQIVAVPGGAVPAGSYRDVLAGASFELPGEIELSPRSALVLVPESDACAPD